MKVWKLVVLTLIVAIFLFPSFTWAQDNTQLNVVSAIDRTFYGNQCNQSEWIWLCQVNSAKVAALGEKDGWEFFSDDLFDSSQNQWIELNFLPYEEKINAANLLLSLRVVDSNMGLGHLEVRVGEKWERVLGKESSDWHIFGGDFPWDEQIDILAVLGDKIAEEIRKGLRLRIQALPFYAIDDKILLAIDQLALQNVSLSPTVTLTPTLTPTSTPIPTPTPTPTPTSASTPTPSDQEKPKASWLNPTENEVVFGKILLKVDMSDNSDDIDEEIYPQFFYRSFGWGQWKAISGKTWDTRKIALGDYQLRARVCDQAGNEKLEEINVGVGAVISNVFLTEGVLSWNTDRLTIGRVIYDRLSHQNVNPNYPNFDYAWSSDEVDNSKTTNHQFVIPSLPPGKYYYRILAFGSPVSYTPEYSFESDNLLSFNNMEDESLILGSVVSATPSVSKEVEVEEETKKSSGLDKRRLLVLIMAGFLCSLGIFYLTKNKKKILMKGNEK
mgnify:CR=1 FL=1